MMATDSLTRNQHEKANRLMELIPSLLLRQRNRDKGTGVRYVTFPSSTDPEHVGHNATVYGCSCKGHKERSMCSHRAAMIRFHQQQEAAIIEAAQRCRGKDCTAMRKTRSGYCEPCFASLADRLGI